MSNKTKKSVDLPGGPVVFRDDLKSSIDDLPKSAFISHTAIDGEFFNKHLSSLFKKSSIHCFFLDYKIATKSPDLADAYKRTIIEQIKVLHWFVVLLSKKSLLSKWVEFEIECALKLKDKSRILSIICDDCNPSEFHSTLDTIPLIDFYNDYDNSSEKLLAILSDLKT